MNKPKCEECDHFKICDESKMYLKHPDCLGLCEENNYNLKHSTDECSVFYFDKHPSVCNAIMRSSDFNRVKNLKKSGKLNGLYRE